MKRLKGEMSAKARPASSHQGATGKYQHEHEQHHGKPDAQKSAKAQRRTTTNTTTTPSSPTPTPIIPNVHVISPPQQQTIIKTHKRSSSISITTPEKRRKRMPGSVSPAPSVSPVPSTSSAALSIPKVSSRSSTPGKSETDDDPFKQRRKKKSDPYTEKGLKGLHEFQKVKVGREEAGTQDTFKMLNRVMRRANRTGERKYESAGFLIEGTNVNQNEEEKEFEFRKELVWLVKMSLTLTKEDVTDISEEEFEEFMTKPKIPEGFVARAGVYIRNGLEAARKNNQWRGQFAPRYEKFLKKYSNRM